MIISLHLPKTAGTSFLAALEQHFGNRLLRDYADRPINRPRYERNKSALQSSLRAAELNFPNVECIHGHFLPVKYLLLADKRNIKFITWLRDPVNRVVSHYHYWNRKYDPKTAADLHRKVVEENWSLEQFCLGPEVRNLYSQFLWGFPVEYFDFIGITEFYEEDFNYFKRHYLTGPIEMKRLNVGGGKGGYQIDASLRKSIESYHANDMELYKRIMENRRSRRSCHSKSFGLRGGRGVTTLPWPVDINN